MVQNKILTIIIPTYNMEKYLRKCLDSLIVSEENMQRLEVLVVNDGSKDSSSQIAHEYQEKYPQTFRVIDKENGNYGSCINRGLKEATGKYVKVLDADDYFDNRVFDDFISFLYEVDVDLVISDFNVVDEVGNCLSDITFDLPTNSTFKLADIPTEMNTLLLHHCITYKRDVFNRFKYIQTEGISYTDDEWVFKPMLWIEKVLYYPHTLYLYLRGREGQTFDPKVVQRTLEQRIRVFKEMVSFYKTNISSCLIDNKSFVDDRLVGRLVSVYNYHLILFPSSANRDRIKSFDNHLKVMVPDIFKQLYKVKSKIGWCYIKQWRAFGYSLWTPELLAMRIKRIIKRSLGESDVEIDRIPDHLKRKV